MAQHRQAEMAFRRCRQLEPHRVRGMEVYSTVLWFLKREHELCYLAQVISVLCVSVSTSVCECIETEHELCHPAQL